MKILKKIEKMIREKITNLLFPVEVQEILENISKTEFRGIRMDDAVVVYNIGIVLFNKSLIYSDVISPLAKFIFNEFGWRANIEYIFSDPENLNQFDYIIAVCGYSEDDSKLSKEVAIRKLDRVENAIHLEFKRVDKFKDVTDKLKYPCIVMKNVHREDVAKHITEKEKLAEKVKNIMELMESTNLKPDKFKDDLIHIINKRSLHFPVSVLIVDTFKHETLVKVVETIKTVNKEISNGWQDILSPINYDIMDSVYPDSIISGIKFFDLVIFSSFPYDATVNRIEDICTANKFKLEVAYSDCNIYYNTRYKKHQKE